MVVKEGRYRRIKTGIGKGQFFGQRRFKAQVGKTGGFSLCNRDHFGCSIDADGLFVNRTVQYQWLSFGIGLRARGS